MASRGFTTDEQTRLVVRAVAELADAVERGELPVEHPAIDAVRMMALMAAVRPEPHSIPMPPPRKGFPPLPPADAHAVPGAVRDPRPWWKR